MHTVLPPCLQNVVLRRRSNFTFMLQHVCGRIIGRNGDSIRNISRASNANIILEGSSTSAREMSKQSFSVQMQLECLCYQLGDFVALPLDPPNISHVKFNYTLIRLSRNLINLNLVRKIRYFVCVCRACMRIAFRCSCHTEDQLLRSAYVKQLIKMYSWLVILN